MQELWKASPKMGKIGILLSGSNALTCRHCGAKLRVQQYPNGWIALAVYLVVVVSAIGTIEATLPKYSAAWFLAMPVVVAGMWSFQNFIAYRLLTVRPLANGEEARFPLDQQDFSLD
jgi:hypothetical protein